MDKLVSTIVLGAVFAAMVQCIGAQTLHVIGDDLGWTVPPNTSVYTNWASSKTFRVGDTLVFNFVTNQHDVVRVPKSSYDACSDDDEIGETITTGPTNVTLDSAGEHYYICTIGSHCQNGQKVAITVVSGTSGANPPTPSTPTTPTTPPTSNQPDACAPTPTPNAGRRVGGLAPPPIGMSPPPPDSSSTFVFASFLQVLLSIAVALVI